MGKGKKRKKDRQRQSERFWRDMKAAYLAGAELRPLARAAGIAEGTLLSRASREKWHKQRERAVQHRMQANDYDDATQSIAIEHEERVRRHIRRMEDLSERVGGRVDRLGADEALDRIRNIDTFDRVTRRTLGIKDADQEERPLINIKLLAGLGPQPIDIQPGPGTCG